MLAQLLLTVALTVANPAPMPDVELFDEAIELLDRELVLLPLVAPSNEGADDFEQNRSELRSVEVAGAELLAELQAREIELTDAIVATLAASAPPAPGSTRPLPPRPTSYATAIQDLRGLAVGGTGEADAAGGADDAAAEGEMRVRTTGLPIPIAAAGLAAVLAAGWVIMRRRDRHLEDAIDQATIDPLTSVRNRRRLETDLSAHEAEEQRRVAVLMVDIDHFKQVNDDHGHDAGDAVLRQVGAILPAVVRADDVVYRYGGEEFCVLLPGASLEEAQMTGERIRVAMRQIPVPGNGSITASIGVAEGLAASTRSAIVRADRALYAAKGAGRDRIELAREPVA